MAFDVYDVERINNLGTHPVNGMLNTESYMQYLNGDTGFYPTIKR